MRTTHLERTVYGSAPTATITLLQRTSSGQSADGLVDLNLLSMANALPTAGKEKRMARGHYGNGRLDPCQLDLFNSEPSIPLNSENLCLKYPIGTQSGRPGNK